jgi:hypothetical protein
VITSCGDPSHPTYCANPDGKHDAVADTFTECAPKMRVNQVLTDRLDVTVTESFGVRWVLEAAAGESAGRPFLA